MMTDPIADMLTRIRNAARARHRRLNVPCAKIKVEVARVLKEQGFIKGYKVIPDRRQGMLRIYLKYTKDSVPVIRGIQRVSKPGRRVYRGFDEMPKVLDGLGVSIVSSSKGVMTNKDCARIRCGGEIICNVW
ncbi:MAG: 30S ribosomal protein S8 [Candidatus Coatesbacteria bacterium]|nr:MAG: 30S ribosomal protein S8 [Candidatus Coatesbacteria bacterium]HDM59709.1 30S ribosomal protein S8 [Bacillota bacterium]